MTKQIYTYQTTIAGQLVTVRRFEYVPPSEIQKQFWDIEPVDVETGVTYE